MKTRADTAPSRPASTEPHGRRGRRGAVADTRHWKIGLIVWLVVGAVWALLFLIPFRYGAIRLALVVGGLAFWGGALALFWKWLPVRILLILTTVLPLLALVFLPDRPVITGHLREEYLRTLRSYLGTPYVWGGETRSGIDCSGLLRQALIEAEFTHGLRSGNGGVLRQALHLWWHDCSARALGEEYRGFTRFYQEVPSLNEADYARLLPGDLAVTGQGSHILAYLGDRTWIQADPKAWKVVETAAPSDDGWLIQEARIMRWTVLNPLPSPLPDSGR